MKTNHPNHLPRPLVSDAEQTEVDHAIGAESPLVGTALVIAREILSITKLPAVDSIRLRNISDGVKRIVTLMRQVAAKRDLRNAAIQQLAAVHAELVEKTEALRASNREASARHIEAKVAEAIEAERAVATAEVASLRAEVARQRSEIDGLRAGKKKLREALDRAKEKR